MLLAIPRRRQFGVKWKLQVWDPAGRPSVPETRWQRRKPGFRAASRPYSSDTGENPRHKACIFRVGRRVAVGGKPDPAQEQLQASQGVRLSIGRLWLALRQMGLRLKKSRSTPRNKTPRKRGSVAKRGRKA